jgi:hypothetical protein
MVEAGGAVAMVATAPVLPADWEPIPVDVLAGCEPLTEDDPAWAAWAHELLEPQPPIQVDELDAEAQLPGAARLAELERLDPTTASDETLALAIGELDRLAAHVEGLRLEMIAALAGPEPATAAARREDWTANHVAMAMRISLPAADRQVALARHLAATLFETLTAMREGRVTLRQALAMHDATSPLPADVARHVEARVLPRAGEQDVSGFRRSLRRAVATLDPQWNTRAVEARRDPAVQLLTGDDGASELWVRGPTETIASIHTALCRYADHTKAELGGSGPARMLHGLHHWTSGRGGGSGASPNTSVNVLIDLHTLLGLRDHPAEAVGYGPIPADAVRVMLAEGAPLRRLVTDPLTGQLLDYGRSTYVVPKPLARYLVAAHQQSRAPYASVPASRCDLDHDQPWSAGGATDRANITPLDRRWHRAKTHGGFTYQRHPDATITWTSPLGPATRSHPPDFRLGP